MMTVSSCIDRLSINYQDRKAGGAADYTKGETYRLFEDILASAYYSGDPVSGKDSYYALRELSSRYHDEMMKHNRIVRFFMKHNPSSESFRKTYKAAHERLVNELVHNYHTDSDYFTSKVEKIRKGERKGATDRVDTKKRLRTIERLEKISELVYEANAVRKNSAGLFWKVTDSEGNVKAYLVGTIHDCTKKMTEVPLVDQVIEECEEFYGELNGDMIRQVGRNRTSFLYGMMHGFLPSRFTPFNRFMDGKIAEKIEKAGSSVDGMETLSAYKAIQKYGDDNKRAMLHRHAIKKAAEKLSRFKLLPSGIKVWARSQFLEQKCIENGSYASWQAGNHGQMDKMMKRINQDETEKEVYLDNRNLSWWNGSDAKGLEDGLKERFDKTQAPIMIFAGSAHFYGENSLVDLIQQDGYAVEEIKSV